MKISFSGGWVVGFFFEEEENAGYVKIRYLGEWDIYVQKFNLFAE